MIFNDLLLECEMVFVDSYVQQDPMRSLAAPRESPSEIGSSAKTEPEWKQQVFKQSVSFGKRTSLSIKVSFAFPLFFAAVLTRCRSSARVCQFSTFAPNSSRRWRNHSSLSLSVRREAGRRRRSHSTWPRSAMRVAARLAAHNLAYIAVGRDSLAL